MKTAPLFSLCHATARIPGWEDAARAWMENCDVQSRFEYILCTDAGSKTPDLWPTFKHVINHGRKCAVDGWNAAAKASTGKFLITVADDWFPIPHWDTELLKVIPDLDKEYVVWLATGGNPNLMTFSCLTRKYYERYGYIFYPEYIGMYADNDFTDCALKDGVVIDCRETLPVFEHLHPAYGTAQWDKVYRWQHRSEAFDVGEQVFKRRIESNFEPEPGILTKAAKALRSAFNPAPSSMALPKRTITFCLPGDTFSMDWLAGMLSVQGVLNEIGFIVQPILGYTSAPHVTRIAIAEAVLKDYAGERSCPYVLWLDDDNIVPVETIRRWVSEFDANPRMDIVVGWCWIQRGPQWVASVARFPEKGIPEFMGLKEIFEGGTKIREVPNLTSGFACVMMRREVLETLGAEAFIPVPDSDAPYGAKGEDASFFWRAKEKGLRSFVDPMGKVGHLKTMLQEPTVLYQNADTKLKGMLDQVNGKPVEAPEEYRNVDAL
jgi:hypothetical protein